LDWIRWAQDSNQWPVFKHGIASSYFLNDWKLSSQRELYSVQSHSVVGHQSDSDVFCYEAWG
jgi:hypothetical protein